ERHDRTAAKPAQRPRQEFLGRGAFGRGIRLRHERPLHEIEVIQEADPRNAAQIMQPAQQILGHRRLRRKKRTARPRSQDMEGTVSRNAGFDIQTSQDARDGTGKRATRGYDRNATRTSPIAIRLRGTRAAHRRADDANPPWQASSDLYHEPQQRTQQTPRAARAESRRAAARN